VADNSFHPIGDPGRGALEVPEGLPPARVGAADIEISSAELPGMRIRAASSRGILHRHQRTVRQDAFALAHRRLLPSEEAAAVLVVCDGVGSLERSDEAAAQVSRRLAELGAAAVPWRDAYRLVNGELRKYAVSASPPGGALTMATTAVAVSVCREGDDWVGEAAWVGDSSLWHLSRRGHWTVITGPSPAAEAEADDYHSGGVRPLPSADGECSTSEFRLSGGALFLMSDGVGNPLSYAPDVRAALAQWWAQPPDPFTFAAQVGFAKRTHIDDRTTVGIWSVQDAGQGDEPGEAHADC
jgi:serine/threonine protein phosphatase PrpC